MDKTKTQFFPKETWERKSDDALCRSFLKVVRRHRPEVRFLRQELGQKIVTRLIFIPESKASPRSRITIVDTIPSFLEITLFGRIW